jgi:hypothetical protein
VTLRRTVSLTLLLLLTSNAPLLFGQGADLTQRQKDIIEEQVSQGKAAFEGLVTNPYSSSVDAGAGLNLVAAWLADSSEDQGRRVVYQKLFDLMEAQTDKQIGAASDTKGSTSLAMKGAAPKILGFAVENGALTQSVRGTVVTFRGSPIGIVKTLEKKGFLDMFQDFNRANQNERGLSSAKLQSFLSGVSFAVSFDTSRGEDPGVLVASRQQVSSWSARAQIINGRDPKGKEYFNNWLALAQGEKANRYLDAQGKMTTAFRDWPELMAWLKNLTERVKVEVDRPLAQMRIDAAEAEERFRMILTAEMPRLGTLPSRPEAAEAALGDYAKQLIPLLEQRAKIRELALKGTILTADWTVSRDPSLPDLSTITAIFETSIGAKKLNDLTLNGTISFFNSALRLPAGNQTVRSYKLTGQYDIPLGDVERVGSFILGFAGRWEHIPNDTLTPGPIVSSLTTPTLKGDIGVFQVKLTMPVKGSGVKIPISFTTSNRTELIKEKDVRMNFGITLDVDSIIAKAFAR